MSPTQWATRKGASPAGKLTRMTPTSRPEPKRAALTVDGHRLSFLDFGGSNSQDLWIGGVIARCCGAIGSRLRAIRRWV